MTIGAPGRRTAGLAVEIRDGTAVLAPLPTAALHPGEQPVVPGSDDLAVSAGLVFSLRSPIGGPGATAAGVIRATDGVLAALEVRPAGAPATAAGWAGRVVLGPVTADPMSLDLSLVGVLLDRDGVQVGTAAGAAAGGHPAGAVATALNAAPDITAEAGWIVYVGPLLPPAALPPGSHARATFAHLGGVGIRALADC